MHFAIDKLTQLLFFNEHTFDYFMIAKGNYLNYY